MVETKELLTGDIVNLDHSITASDLWAKKTRRRHRKLHLFIIIWKEGGRVPTFKGRWGIITVPVRFHGYGSGDGG